VNISWLGLGVPAPASVPDPLTVYGVGTTGGQIRLTPANGNYGVILRNDGGSFFVMNTAAADPYGAYVSPYPLAITLATGAAAFAGAVSAASLSCATVTASGAVTVGSVSSSGQILLDSAQTNDGTFLDLGFGTFNEGVSSVRVAGKPNVNGLNLCTNRLARITITNGGQVGVNYYPPDQPSHALCVNGLIHTASGIVFGDGSTQTTAPVPPVIPPQGLLNVVNLPMSAPGGPWQNTHATPMLVIVNVALSAGAYCEAYIGPTASPPLRAVRRDSWSDTLLRARSITPVR
jgi:hypothetical protein